LIGGLVMGVLSALPLVSAGNVCCCMWVVGGGMVAAYMLQQQQQTPIAPGDAALVGLLAGIIGAGVQLVVSIPIDLLVAPMERAMLQRALDLAGSMPPELRETIERYSRSGEFSVGFFALRHVFGLFFWMFIGGIFSTIGGLLGHVMFKKTVSPGVIDVPKQP
jgi:hypothetical protein